MGKRVAIWMLALRAMSGSAFLILLTACVSFPDAVPEKGEAAIEDPHFLTRDGEKLRFDRYAGQGEPRAILLALHGMNDYANNFAEPAPYWGERGVMVYAVDQRGFGRNRNQGDFAGSEIFVSDLLDMLHALRAVHGDTPLFVLGHSMGGAIILAALQDHVLPVDGVIVAAPAVWGASQMPLAYRLAANVAASLMPNKTLTGERAARQATDNIEILQAMARDPHIIKQTNLIAVLGMTRLMGAAWQGSAQVGGDILFLIGHKDEIIPPKTMRKAAGRLCGAVQIQEYEQGWHLLFRDLQASIVWQDVIGFIEQQLWAKKRDTTGQGNGAAGPAVSVCAE